MDKAPEHMDQGPFAFQQGKWACKGGPLPY